MGQQWAQPWAPRALIGTIVPQGQHIIENSLKPAVYLLQWAQRALIEPIDPQGQQSIENRPKPAFCLLHRPNAPVIPGDPISRGRALGKKNCPLLLE